MSDSFVGCSFLLLFALVGLVCLLHATSFSSDVGEFFYYRDVR